MAKMVLLIQDGEKKRPPFTVTHKAFDITYRDKGYQILDERESEETPEPSNNRPPEFYGTFDPDKNKTGIGADVSAKSIAESLGVETGGGVLDKEPTAPNNKISATGKSVPSKTKPVAPKKAIGKSASRPNSRAADSGQNRPANVVTQTNESASDNKTAGSAGTGGGNSGGAGTGGGDA